MLPSCEYYELQPVLYKAPKKPILKDVLDFICKFNLQKSVPNLFIAPRVFTDAASISSCWGVKLF